MITANDIRNNWYRAHELPAALGYGRRRFYCVDFGHCAVQNQVDDLRAMRATIKARMARVDGRTVKLSSASGKRHDWRSVYHCAGILRTLRVICFGLRISPLVGGRTVKIDGGEIDYNVGRLVYTIWSFGKTVAPRYRGRVVLPYGAYPRTKAMAFALDRIRKVCYG